MSMWQCSLCGCSSKHYNSNRASYVCDQCGHPVEDFEMDRQRQSYDRDINLAKQHLSVGNWDSCRGILLEICYMRPADAQLYLMLLACVTKAYDDYLLDNPLGCSEAADYWDKLAHLRKINRIMRDYQFRRERILKKQVRMKFNCLMITVGLIVGLLMVVPALSNVSGWLTFFSIVAACILFKCNVYDKEPFEIIRNFVYMNKTKLDNPFKYKV